MFAIYKYTLKKYFKAPSTWIIMAVSMFIGGFIGGYLPFSLFSIDGKEASEMYIMVSGLIIMGVTTFLSIFASIFAGFKAATMFRDEVEDGTFLVILSKPLKRGKIVLGKWFALQTIMLLYTFMSVLAFAICIIIFDIGKDIPNLSYFGVKSMRSGIPLIALFMWGIVSLIGLIFSSIALVLSTKLTVGSTIGISIAIGVIIPITSLVGTFTQRQEFKQVTSAKMFALSDIYNAVANSDELKRFNVEQPAGIQNDLNDLNGVLNDPHFIQRMGIATGETNAFSKLWGFDLNYQIGKLANFAVDNAIPSYANELATEVAGDQMQGLANQFTTTKDESSPLSEPVFVQRESQNKEYNYIINQLRRLIPITHRVSGKLINYFWDIIWHEILHSDKLIKSIPGIPSNLASALNKDTMNFVAKALGKVISVDAQEINDHSKVHISDILKAFHYEKTVGGNSDKADFLREQGFNSTQIGDIKAASINGDYTNINVKDWRIAWWLIAAELSKPDATDNTKKNTHLNMELIWNGIDSIFSMNGPDGTKRDFNSIVGKEGSPEQVSLLNAFGFISDLIPRKLESYKDEKYRVIGEAMKSYSGQILSMLSPLSYTFFHKENLDQIIKNKKIDLSKVVTSIKEFKDAENLNGQSDTIVQERLNNSGTRVIESDLHNQNLLPEDKETLQRLLSLAYDKPEMLVKLSEQNYIDKLTLLWVYLGIALFLVPVTYVIVRRQDFR